ncbi:17443_t:CDS:10 [Entrophospora sp. SA101]|nr:17443_t:CDS:10 [Entrophospora sp. SA101]
MLQNPFFYLDLQDQVLFTLVNDYRKTHIIHELSDKFNVKLITITIGDLSSEFPLELEKGLDQYFSMCSKNQPSVWTSTNVNLINPIIVNTFQDEIEIEIPTPDQRLEILKSCIEKKLNLEDDVNLKEINQKCHGYVAADIVCLCRLALETCESRSISETGKPGQLKINNKDFQGNYKNIIISNLQERFNIQKIESIRWSDIGGLDEAKEMLEESIIWMYKYSDSFKRLGLKPSKGVLLYGPPGTGKTLLAKAVATESSANFLPISIPDLIKCEIGESEKSLARIFKIAINCSPCVIFMDELEAMFGNRESSSTYDQGVVILATTNNPEKIDNSLLRPGRLDRLIYIKPPNFQERLSILNLLSKRFNFNNNQINFHEISLKTQSFTGADLKFLLERAAFIAFKKYKLNKSQTDFKKQINQTDILEALSTFQPSISLKQLGKYDKFSQSFI